MAQPYLYDNLYPFDYFDNTLPQLTDFSNGQDQEYQWLEPSPPLPQLYYDTPSPNEQVNLESTRSPDTDTTFSQYGGLLYGPQFQQTQSPRYPQNQLPQQNYQPHEQVSPYREQNTACQPQYIPGYNFPSFIEDPLNLPICSQPPLQHPRPVQLLPNAHETQLLVLLKPPPASSAPPTPLEWKNEFGSPVVAAVATPVTPVVEEEVVKPTKKRKARCIAPASEERLVKVLAKEEPITPPLRSPVAVARSLEECMGLFDATLTATKEKRRRKVFSAQEKKVVKSVRNVGACIQCKFRKKTCSAGKPCPYCARFAGSVELGMRLCHRESPFINRTMLSYYHYTSRKRIIDFNLITKTFKGARRVISIDLNGPASKPLHISVVKSSISNLGIEDVAQVMRTAEPVAGLLENGAQSSPTVDVIEPGSLSISDLENWAFECTYEFSKSQEMCSTGFIFGVEYAALNLPYSALVTKVTRLVSLNFILREGITVIPESLSTSPEHFRVIQAQIDTLLYRSFQATEKSIYQDLQRLVFRSAGSLSRDAVVPVCLCVWQLARLQCLFASHVSNLAYNRRVKLTKLAPPAKPGSDPKSKPADSGAGPVEEAPTPEKAGVTRDQNRSWEREEENLTYGLNLLLCTFEALFRSSCPLLLDWEDPFSRELLGKDEKLVWAASRMSRTLRLYRAKGHTRRFKLGVAYRKEMADRLRKMLRDK